MEILAPYQSHQLDSYKNNQSIKRYNYSSGIEGQGHKPYAFVISKDNAMQMVIFEPDEVMLKDIRNRAPRKVFYGLTAFFVFMLKLGDKSKKT